MTDIFLGAQFPRFSGQRRSADCTRSTVPVADCTRSTVIVVLLPQIWAKNVLNHGSSSVCPQLSAIKKPPTTVLGIFVQHRQQNRIFSQKYQCQKDLYTGLFTQEIKHPDIYGFFLFLFFCISLWQKVSRIHHRHKKNKPE